MASDLVAGLGNLLDAALVARESNADLEERRPRTVFFQNWEQAALEPITGSIIVGQNEESPGTHGQIPSEATSDDQTECDVDRVHQQRGTESDAYTED